MAFIFRTPCIYKNGSCLVPNQIPFHFAVQHFSLFDGRDSFKHGHGRYKRNTKKLYTEAEETGREFSLYKNTYKSRGVVMLKREIERGLTGMQEFWSPMRHSTAPEISVFATRGAVLCWVARPLCGEYPAFRASLHRASKTCSAGFKPQKNRKLSALRLCAGIFMLSHFECLQGIWGFLLFSVAPPAKVCAKVN